MVFKFSTFDPTEDPPDFDPHSPPASRSSTFCLPLDPSGCSFIRAVTSCQVGAGASQRLANSASKLVCWRPSESVQFPEEGRLKRFAFHELKVATNSFSDTKKVGEGGFGCVYEGVLGDGDIKPDNILLDEDLEARIGDFGLALFIDEYKEKAVPEGGPNGEDAYFTSCAMGTLGYMDPERFTGRNSVKSDVYGFGVTLLELISSRRARETTCLDGNELGLLQWARALFKNEQLERLADTDMPGGYNESEVEKTVRLALLCTQSDPKKRPHMAEAVLFLEGIISLEKRWEDYRHEHEVSDPANPSSSSDCSSCPREEELSGPR
ncbi:somatic embryogenesis receptor kinase 2-like [Rhodamnia argentea]|uniref:Somatic embryogenesis receptor kinase 2-like n=1 Tax=Rhodamnia argentea TaxID=178133 RepID=A0ABM3GTW2_9MYRT|nr:somatic embryogenesis receptor kinase 2-like [Rhodamnia argentea]